MIDVRSPAAYQLALQELVRFKQARGRSFKGRFIQLFLGLKYWQGVIPSMYSGQTVNIGVLQTLLDDLYSKAGRALNDCVLTLFEGSYHARTGIVGVGNRAAQNTWRNNLHLQKGVVCYAPVQELSRPTFLSQSRSQCQYLLPVQPGQLSNAQCTECTTGATYRNEDHPKWLRIDPTGHEFATVDLMNTTNFVSYVAPNNGARLPIVPLIVALYHDPLPGLQLGTRNQLDIADFADDFGFTPQEFAVYFDDDYANSYNQALLQAYPNMQYQRLLQGAAAGTPRRRGAARANAPGGAPQAPVMPGTPVNPPAANNGWAAEQFVAQALRQAGWTVWDVSRQKLGYDLLAQRGKQTRYVDAKSSVGTCSPSLTAREWQQATTHGAAYVLAILENFNPTGQNQVQWVADPAGRCTASSVQTTTYSIARRGWRTGVIGITQI